eukprot:gene20578-27374_t
MKLKELQMLMQDVAPFKTAKVDLEQYPTGVDLASRMLFMIDSDFNDFEGKSVIDLGCGTAMLCIGAAILGAPHVIGIDVDPDALEVAQENCDQFDDPLPIDFVLYDVLQLASCVSLGPLTKDDDKDIDFVLYDVLQLASCVSLGPLTKDDDKDIDFVLYDVLQLASCVSLGPLTKDDDKDIDFVLYDVLQLASCVSLGPLTKDDDKDIDFILCDVLQLASSVSLGPSAEDDEQGACEPGRSKCSQKFLQADTVIMNPPFGTKRIKGADMEFLKAGFALSRGSVYSLHKTLTRAHIQKVAERDLGAASAKVLAEMKYNLPASMKFHKQKSVDIAVDLWRFEVGHS